MNELKKLKITPYEYADEATRAKMDPMVDFIERRQTMESEIKNFGSEAEQRFRLCIRAIEKFLEDPTSPEADKSIRDRLRDDYLAAAENMALTIGAGEE